jgi:lipid A disaccharide synthetase
MGFIFIAKWLDVMPGSRANEITALIQKFIHPSLFTRALNANGSINKHMT